MKEIIERMQKAERDADGVLKSAESEAAKIIEDARAQVRELTEKSRKLTQEKAEAVVAQARESVKQERVRLVKEADSRIRVETTVDPKAEHDAVEMIFDLVAFPGAVENEGREGQEGEHSPA